MKRGFPTSVAEQSLVVGHFIFYREGKKMTGIVVEGFFLFLFYSFLIPFRKYRLHSMASLLVFSTCKYLV